MKKKILVTGASSGIGRATSLMLARKGHSVLMAARRVDRLREIASAEATIVGELLVAELDVSSSDSVDKFLTAQGAWLQDVDVLVNNAGLALGRESFQESALPDIEQVIQTNVMGLLRVSRKILPFMVARKSGHIVNLGSVAGRTAYPGGTVYCATKAAVHMMTEALRYDLGGTGVRVSTVAPGRVAETEFSEIRFKGDKEKAAQVYQGFRTMTATDVAEAIAWIVERPAHVNIQEIVLMPTDQISATTMGPLK